MPVSEPLGDRRTDVRLEIIGALWATLVTNEPFPLLDLGPGGACVGCGRPLAVGCPHQVRLSLGEDACDVRAIVKHVTPDRDDPGRYLVGLAFVNVSRETEERIATFLRAVGSADAGKER